MLQGDGQAQQPALGSEGHWGHVCMAARGCRHTAKVSQCFPTWSSQDLSALPGFFSGIACIAMAFSSWALGIAGCLFPSPQVSVCHWLRLGCLVGLEICFEIGVRKHFPSSWVFRVVTPLNLLWSVLVWLRALGIIFVILRIKVAKEPRRRKTETYPSADQVWFAKLPASFWFLWLQLARAEWIALLSGCCL